MDTLLALVFWFGLLIAVVMLVIGIVFKLTRKPAKHIFKRSGIIFAISMISFVLFAMVSPSDDTTRTAGTEQTRANGESIQEDKQVSSENKSTSEDSNSETQELENEREDHGTRTSPIPFGESTMRLVDINDPEQDSGFLRLTLSNLISGEEAYNFLLNENQFNEQAPEGYQWIVFDVTGELVEGSDNESYVSYPQVSTVSESGSESPDGHYATITNEYGGTDLYKGGTATGKIATIAPENEDYTIKWIEDYGEPVFFDNE